MFIHEYPHKQFLQYPIHSKAQCPFLILFHNVPFLFISYFISYFTVFPKGQTESILHCQNHSLIGQWT